MTDLVSPVHPSAEPSVADSKRSPRGWMLWAIAVASMGVIGSLILALASEQLDLPGLRAFLIAWIVIPYVVSGILAWWRRPESRLGH